MIQGLCPIAELGLETPRTGVEDGRQWYDFKVYALAVTLDLPRTATKAALLRAMKRIVP